MSIDRYEFDSRALRQLASRSRPEWTLPCHGRDHGFKSRRSRHWPSELDEKSAGLKPPRSWGSSRGRHQRRGCSSTAEHRNGIAAMRVRLPPAPPRRGVDQGSIACKAGSCRAAARCDQRLRLRSTSSAGGFAARSTDLSEAKTGVTSWTRRWEFDSLLPPFPWRKSSNGRTPGNSLLSPSTSSVSFSRHAPRSTPIFERGAGQGYIDYQSKGTGSNPVGSITCGPVA